MILGKKQIKGQLYALLAGVLFGSVGFLVIQVIDAGIPIPTALFWRFLVASVVLVPFLFSRSQIILNRKNVVITLITGVLLNGPYILFFYIASRKIGLGLTTTIVFCFPIVVTLLAWITKSEVLGKRTIVALASITIGLSFLYDEQNALNVFGALFAALAAIAYGVCIFANKKYSSELPIYNSTFMICFGSTVFFLGISLLNGDMIIPNDAYTWINIVIAGVFCTLLPIIFFFKALQYISAVQISVLLTSEPLFSIFLAVVGLNEVINLKQSIAIAIILISIIMHQVMRKDA